MEPQKALDFKKASDDELVKGVLNRDVGAENEFVQRHKHIVSALASKYRSNHPGQEFDELENYGLNYMMGGFRLTTDGRVTPHRPPIAKWLEGPRSNLAGFIAISVDRLFKDWIRQNKNKRKDGKITDSLSDDAIMRRAQQYEGIRSATTNKGVDAETIHRAVLIALSELPPPKRQMLIWKYDVKQSDAEIGKALGVAESTARRLRKEAELHFRRLFEVGLDQLVNTSF